MTTPSNSDTEILFTEFSLRMLAVVLDFLIVFFLSYVVQDYIFETVKLTSTNRRSINIAVLLLYFVTSWLSPMRATPTQFLLGMRVVDETGERLNVVRAVLRAGLLVGSILAAMTLIDAPPTAHFRIVVPVSYVLFILAAVTQNRQAAHDLLAHSIVVNKIAFKSPEGREQLRKLVTASDPASRKQSKPSVPSIVANMFMLGIPMFLLFSYAESKNDRNLRSRVAYAVAQVVPLRLAVDEFYSYYKRWPTKGSKLDAATRADYREGGYYELEDDGVIRIRFTVKPELTRGSIVVSPTVVEDGITWECHADADISRGHLPAVCRH